MARLGGEGMVPPGARTSTALAALSAALQQTIMELEQLVGRADLLRAKIDAGTPLSEALAAEDRPLIITRLVGITDRLNDVGGEVRRAEARQLRDEGYTHDQIAAVFGVSRQRTGALLKEPPAVRQRPKRPRPTTPP